MIDISVNKWSFLGYSGFALPPIGIFVGKMDQLLIMHEFGHVLQARKYGLLIFYIKYAIPSVYSFYTNRKMHKYFYAELDANKLAIEYFETRVSSEILSKYIEWTK
jgi:hypothetical protein